MVSFHWMQASAAFLFLAFVSSTSLAAVADAPLPDAVPPLKVFLLAGQSNMVGMGSIRHLDMLVRNASKCNEYRDKLWNGTAYKKKDNVYVKFGDQQGKLTVGPFAGKDSFGPELMFGWTMGDALANETILLIKTAWGGKNLAIDFRPPSSGEGNYSGFKPIQYGVYYRQMVLDILDTLSDLSSYVPEYNKDIGFELAGFVWFQGWNDMLDMVKVDEYGHNLANMIRDVRLDLSAPHLPVLVGELGMHGLDIPPEEQEAPRILGMRAQQHGVTLLKPFQNNTLFVRTAPYAINCNGSDRYNGIEHYWGRADTYFHIGQAFGRGALKMMNMSITIDAAVSSKFDCDVDEEEDDLEMPTRFKVWPFFEKLLHLL